MKRSFFFLIMIAIFVTGCAKTENNITTENTFTAIDVESILENQKIVFFMSAIAYSEGYANHGYFIDNQGMQHFYDMSDLEKTEDQNVIYERLISHYDQYNTINQFYDKQTLDRSINLLYNIDSNSELIVEGEVVPDAYLYTYYGVREIDGKTEIVMLTSWCGQTSTLDDKYALEIMDMIKDTWQYDNY